MSLLSIKDLTIKYDEYIFEKFNLEINYGDRLVIIGPSGSGKTSLIKALLGQVEYEGQINASEEVKYSYMPQSLALFPHKTVEQNIRLPYKIKKDNREIDHKLYEEFGLTKLLNKYPHQLSGGQAQRVSLLRALIDQANILCIDEPLSKLDQITKEKMIEFFLEQFKENCAVFYITHDLNEAIKIATKIIVINDEVTIVDSSNLDDALYEKLKQLIMK